MEQITISNFLNTSFKDYSLYTIENRAIPSVIDGFKPVLRKIVYVSDKHVRNTPNKVSTLAGKVISDCKYHHGNVSCEDAIIGMTQEFKNNFPLFTKVGQFGSRLSPNASASRYISVKLSKNFDLLYKDNDLLTEQYDEGELIEPKFYLPIIPTVLINGNSGIATGFATNILNRDIISIIDACLTYLDNKKISSINPHIYSFTGNFIQDEENTKKWYIKGKFNINGKKVTVTELPPSMTYEKFENHLDKLENDKVIDSWDNFSKKNICYIIKLNSEVNDNDIDKLLKLTDIENEIFTVLDEKGKLKIFENVYDIIKYFVDFRIQYYFKRKEKQIKDTEYKIIMLTEKSKFIKLVNENKIKILKCTKDEIVKQIEKCGLVKIENSYDYLLNLSVNNLTNEKYEEILKLIESTILTLEQIKNKDCKKEYISELKELKIKVS